MKKGAWVAGVLAAAVIAAGGGLLAVHILESKTEQAVRAALADVSATADSVDYNLLNNTLNLDRLACTFELMGQRNAVTIEHVSVAGFNRACLNSGTGSELPLVADSLTAFGMEVITDAPAISGRGTVAEIRVEGWYQNLGKLAALYRREPWSEAFFAEAYRYRLDMMACKDYHLTFAAKGQKSVTMDMAMYGLLGPAGSRDVSSDAGRTISVFMNDVRMASELSVSSVKRVEVHEMLMPSPASAGRLMSLASEIQAVGAAGSDAGSELLEAFLKEGVEAYRDSTPYKEIVLQSCAVQLDEKGAQALMVDEVRHKLSLADPVVFGLDVTGLHVSWEELSSGWDEVGPAFLPEGPLVDGSILLSLRTERRPSRVEWSAGIRNLGRAESKITLELDIKKFSDVAKLSSDKLMDHVFLKDAEAEYADHGLEALALTVAALDGGSTLEQDYNEYKAALPMLRNRLGELGPMLEAAASTMLDRPGTVRIQCRPERPLAWSQVVMGLLLQPQALNLTVSAEPGNKTLLEWVPAGVKR